MRRNYDSDLEPDIKYPFYRATDEQLVGEPGSLINHELVPQHLTAALAEASATYRVLYRSRSGIGDKHAEDPTAPTDDPIAVSGLIAFPPGDAPADGWPVLSWAHGTVGSNDLAAPSMDPYVAALIETMEIDPAKDPDRGLGLLRKINKAPHALLNAFLKAGWAVAMTDYEGLGTYGNHPYLLGVSQGRGILDIVPAVHELAAELERKPKIANRYAIAGHSQGGQAALWAAHLASTGAYPTSDKLIGVAALAPASNLKGELTGDLDSLGLVAAYSSPAPMDDLGGFYVLFSNGVFAGDPSIDPALIFQPDALAKYKQDFNTKARAELSDEEFWTTRPPLAVPPWDRPLDRTAGIFTVQVGGGAERTQAWTKYWAQVDAFTPDRLIKVPIRISQAMGDTRVKPFKTTQLIGQLSAIPDIGPMTTPDFYPVGTVPKPDPEKLGEHFGLLVYKHEIDAILKWFAKLPS